MLKGAVFIDTIVWLGYLYTFVLGISVASFVNVAIWRIPLEISLAKGRSFCPACKHTLGWLDLFPVVSFLFLKGKCRYCGAKIPWYDVMIEFLGGCFAMFCFYHYGFVWDTLIVFSVGMILLAVAAVDFKTMTIPNGFVLLLIIPAILMTVVHPEITITERFIGFVCVSVPMYLLTVVIPDCFGGGDIKLLAVAGFMLGWQHTLLSAFIAIMLCGVYATWLLITKKAKKGVHIAFGPYLCVGFMVSLFYGNIILSIYLNTLYL